MNVKLLLSLSLDERGVIIRLIESEQRMISREGGAFCVLANVPSRRGFVVRFERLAPMAYDSANDKDNETMARHSQWKSNTKTSKAIAALERPTRTHTYTARETLKISAER